MAAGLEARRIVREVPDFRNKLDAAHIASATRFSIEPMRTYDRPDLIDFSGLLPCKNGNPLIICYPDETTGGSLLNISDDDSLKLVIFKTPYLLMKHHLWGQWSANQRLSVSRLVIALGDFTMAVWIILVLRVNQIIAD